MRIEAGALAVDTKGLRWPLVAVLFVLVHVCGPILWVAGWAAYHLGGGDGS